MDTRIYFVRHGETEWNSSNRFQGSTDVPLSAKGLQQAKKTALRLKNLKIDVIASSSLSRALDTANVFADMVGKNVEIYEGLKEINFGDWEGMTESEILKLYGEQYREWRSNPKDAAIPGEGSLNAAAQRGFKALEELVEKHNGKTIAVFAHASIIKSIILKAIGADFSIYNNLWLHNASITIVDHKGSQNGKFVLSLLNDYSHL